MASEGYPGHYERDRVINNLEEAERMADVKVFHAGTALRTDPHSAATAGSSPTAAGCSTSPRWATTLADAQARAYEAVRAIRFTGAWYRRDIAERATKAKKPAPPA